ncbi:membrane protein insertase YidC [Haliangium ochraceum]|uniref:Membrane protein insertase YidC n=1 Tax=Haliangium ochraceum (strain DSM 14365 / JCM 11303 / SMP-2) TaxID=502025 RepID=D0LVP2_HALO1|nr:membrane protein insertase YidC [Haliangium ochraceum]ACY19360.1 membrane protein insertase, YidC/Oxa1 family [Haliangium ochraceum DSM 14365]
MEEQSKRLLLAVGLAFVVMMGWTYLFPPEPPPEEVPSAEQSAGSEETPDKPALPKPTLNRADQTGDSAGDGTGAIGLAEAQPAQRGEEQLYEFRFDKFRAVFTSHGATLKSWELLGDKYRGGEGEDAKPLDLVPLKDESLLPFQLGFEGVDLLPAQTEWRVERQDETTIDFLWSYTAEQNGEEVVLFDIVKSYRLYPEQFLVELNVSVENRNASEQDLELVLSMFGYQDPNAASGGWFASIDLTWKGGCLIDEELETQTVEDLEEGAFFQKGDLAWTGLTHNYFLFAASPKNDTDARIGCRLSTVEGETGVMRADILFPAFRVRAGDPRMLRSVVAYIGPKYVDKLEAIPGVIAHNPHFEKSVDLGWFGFFAAPLLWLLRMFESLVGNWGVAIVLLTVLVKLTLLPFTTKSMRSMKQMSKLRPKIEALQKKYKDDRQRQQEEMMALYRTHGVNPVAGCLPMLLQMPIWFALYRMLMTAGELYHAPLVPGWIDDLTAVDPYYILPILLVVMMFLQAKLSPTQPDSPQQKMMMYGLPLSFGVFSFFLPSGLTLYILTNTFLTAVHHIWINHSDPVAKPVSEVKKSGEDAKPSAGKSKVKAASAKAAAAAAISEDDEDEADEGDSSADSEERDSAAGKPSGKGGKGGAGKSGKSGQGPRNQRNTSKKRGGKSRKR